MSAWLARARTSIACFEARCGGADLCSNDERMLIYRATVLAERLAALEASFDFFTTPVDMVEVATRGCYFRSASDLKFLLNVINKRYQLEAA